VSLFKTSQDRVSKLLGNPVAAKPIDLSKRYDVYCWFVGESRVYEDVRITGIRTLSQEPTAIGVVDGYIEIEATDGTRAMMPRFHIHMLCEHGLQPSYKVLRTCQPKDGATPEE
jgi:hypothetical protein